MDQNGVALDGYPSMDEIAATNGWPGISRFLKGPVAVIECVQPIPCNPCESACPRAAIDVGDPITNIPQLDADKCTGCGLCVAACPGLAIFIVNKSLGEGRATVSFPYEYLPLPETGDTVRAAGRNGAYICDAVVTRVVTAKAGDRTPVITLEVPVRQADSVRGMERTGAQGVGDAFSAAQPLAGIPDDMLICRCEEVTAAEIRRAIRIHRARTVTEVKRRVRCGMGLCQGKSCGRLIMRLLAEENGAAFNELTPDTDRPPVRPITFEELAGRDAP